jgi:hypothetical protein
MQPAVTQRFPAGDALHLGLGWCSMPTRVMYRYHQVR